MNKIKQLPLVLAAVWMIIQLLLFNFNVSHHFRTGAFFNIFFILAVVVLSMYLQIREEKKLYPFATNFKNSLKQAGKYIVLVGIFLFIYLKFINPQFLEKFRELRIEMALNEDFEKVQKSFPQYETFEDYKEQVYESSKIISSPTLIISFYFLFLFLVSIVFSIGVPLFYKKVVLRM